MEPGVRGVFFCDSPWLCPSCAPRRAAERAERVNRVFDAAEAQGGHLLFITLTVRHSRRQPLAEVKRMVSTACRKARQGAPWAKAVKKHGIMGALVSPEVTWSRVNGWHYHIHMGVVLKGKPENKGDVEATEADASEAGEWLVARYRDYIEKEGGTALRKAQDVTLIWRRDDAADYLAKGTAGWEVASAGATKQAKTGKKRIGMTPWDLAARAALGDRSAAALFREYAATMPGARSCVVTKSLADNLGLKPEDDADAPGVDEKKVEETVVGSLEPPRWHRLLRRGHAADVLKAVSDGRDWASIEGFIKRVLGEIDIEVVKPTPAVREHSPPAWLLASKASAEAHLHRNRKGAALQAVLEQERRYAQERGLLFLPPDLRDVFQLLAT